MVKSAWSALLVSSILALPTSSTLAAGAGWHTDTQGKSYWHVSPRVGPCNVSQATNRAIRAGIYRSEIVYRDDDVVTLRGLTLGGDRKEITFANVQSCPELESRDVP
jgi:hypothetical protein